MQEVPTPSARSGRQRGAWTFAPIALVALVSIGCPAPTPIKEVSVTPPSFLRTVENLTYTVDALIDTLVLPTASGGTGTLTYSLGPEVPGLEFDRDARTLSGTPTTADIYRMTYVVTDEAGETDRLAFTITIHPSNALTSVMSAVAVGDVPGVPRFEALPEDGGGPAVSVSGNHVFVQGGSIFLDVEPAPGSTVDKLLVAIDGEDLAHYEIDLQGAESSYPLLGRLRHELDPELRRLCLWVQAVDDRGAAGPAACHPLLRGPVDGGDVEITLSWDSDADLNLHVADPTGAEVYYFSEEVESGGVLDFSSNDRCRPDGRIDFRNEHIAWSAGSPPPGIYEVRVDHWSSCDAPETNYVVSVYNHGRTTTFSGTFTGRGDKGDRGSGRVITRFAVTGDAPPPPRPTTLSSTYLGSGDQVFVLNPDGEVLDDTQYTLHLGNASAEVYVIATAGNFHMDPQVDRLDLRESTAEGQRAAAHEDHQPEPRPSVHEPAPERAWVTEFNNNPPLSDGSDTTRKSVQAQSQRSVAVGDTFDFIDRDDDGELAYTPATVRRVIVSGSTRLAVWVADSEWGTTCRIAAQCLDRELVDAIATSFLRPGPRNDIYDWVTAIFGVPWGPHSNPLLIPPEAAGEIHILLFDIDGDGIPAPGDSRTVGFFVGLNNYRRLPDHPRVGHLLKASNERLMFFMDSPFLVIDPDATISVLAHEYQHMIHFYQKPILRGAGSEAWLNEMASEVAQDLIAYQLIIDGPRAVAYDDPTAGDPRNRSGRLGRYNLYNDIQVTTWDGYLANYSINYALGAYLARNYGGAELFGRIVQSDRAGVSAIEGALRDLGHDASFVELLANWGAATLLSDNTDAPAPYQYNTASFRTSRSADGQLFRLGSINLFNYIYAPGRLARPGPFLHALPLFNERTQPPHSNMYTILGRNTGTIRLRVSAGDENRITVVVKE